MRNSKYYRRLGKEVSHTVRNAVRSGHFEEIGRAVGGGVQEFTDDLKDTIEGGRRAVSGSPRSRTRYRSPDGDYRGNSGYYPPSPEGRPSSRKSNVHPGFRASIPGKVSGLVYMIIGISLGVPLLIADISVFSIFAGGLMPAMAFNISGSILSSLAAAFFLMLGGGIARRRRAIRFERYRDALGGAAFCEIARLADTVGESKDRTKKDLKKLIACGVCPQGHLDRDETCFMVDDKTYEEYLEAEKAYAARAQAEKEARRQEQADPKQAELAAVKKEGAEYLTQIRAVNDALPEKEITEKLDRLENVTARIFACVAQHPAKLPEIRRFMRYYMPTTLKLVQAYREFELQPVQGDNILRSKEEIKRALDTVNTAFGNLLDTLFADDALDISTDISTLETMLRQEGLTGSDFTEAPDKGEPS